jgi:aerobic carbon-monoxide dehydrogenase medium subunit
VKPAPFKYLVAESLDHALSVKAEYGEEAKFLAGGQSLIPAMNFRLAEPALLVDINALTALDYIREGGDGAVRIGALVRQRALERDPLIARHQPLVREAAGHVAHPQIRNRGTLCGNLAHADPASEQPAVLLALGARLRAQSASGDRWIEARDFFVSLFTTALEEDEMLVEVDLPALAPRTGTSFIELARRPGDYAMMGVAAVVTLDEDGTCADARLTYCNAGEIPVAADRAARSLVGGRIGDEQLRSAGDLARKEISPTGNAQASEAFQRHLAAVLTGRAVKRALSSVGQQEVRG